MSSIASEARPAESRRDDVQLTFDQPVPGRLVHRVAVCEVLMTDSSEVGEDRFVAGAQLPLAHRFFSDTRSSCHDPLTAVEAGRQGTVLLAHRHYGVPEDFSFISQKIDLHVEDAEAFRIDGGPANGVFHVTVSDKQYRDDVLAGMAFEAGFEIDGRHAASMSGGMIFLPSEDFAALRAHIREPKQLDGKPDAPLPERLDPELVGRFDERNVVIGEAGGEQSGYEVVVDREHPSLWDHPYDHVPGTLLLEAYRQAAVATAGQAGAVDPAAAIVTRARVRFWEFAELELPTICTAEVAGERSGDAVTVELGLHQAGKQISKCSIDLTPCG